MTMLADFSAAQPTSIHRRIMLARGVIVPQRQTLRAVAFPAAVVGEAIHAPVADAERQLLEHHVHRDHSTLVRRESCATRSVAADINTHHPATPSSHIERPKSHPVGVASAGRTAAVLDELMQAQSAVPCLQAVGTAGMPLLLSRSVVDHGLRCCRG
jgi:hypothetical protein